MALSSTKFCIKFSLKNRATSSKKLNEVLNKLGINTNFYKRDNHVKQKV